MPPKKSVDRKRGNRLGLWFFSAAARLFGLRGAYGLLYIVSLYYLLFDRAAVSASLAYVRRRFPRHGALRRTLDVYRLFVSQGKQLVDRFAAASGYPGFTITIKGYEEVRAHLDKGQKGIVLLTAHVGNWQVAMTALRRFGRTVYLMMRHEDNAAVRQALRIEGEEERVRFLFTDDELGGVLEAMKAIDRGEVVSIMGDRTYGYSAAGANFLGGEVRFPVGAFSIASAAQCPLVVMLTSKTSANAYQVDVSRIIAPSRGARREKNAAVGAAVQEFARALEGYVTDHPYQWFVFRDIWTSNE